MARVFANGTLTGSSSNLGKYYWDFDDDGTKGTCDADGHECIVDTNNNVAEGNLKGTYTQVANKSQVKPLAQKPVDFSTLATYTDTADFLKKADNTMAAQMRDCAECHVGGGAMEYVPVAQGTVLDPGVRVELRTDQTTTIVGNGDFPINTFNYFIDQYDENNDTITGEVLQQDYADTGVLEMDCLMCHMDGYSWEERKEAIRKGNFDASRVAGAGLGSADNVTLGSSGGSGYGKVVTYDTTMVESDGSGNATLTALALNAIESTPPNANCSACHFDLHKVDWKKRGASWTANMSPDTEAHASLGCMGCHTRDDGVEMDPNNTSAGTGDSPLWTGNGKSGAEAAMLGHDPTKGAAPFSSLWNANDNNVRTCRGCHLVSEGKSYQGYGGAVDPTDAHEAKGLTAILIQTKGMGKMDGTADGSHLDLMTCAACHTKKMGHGPDTNGGANESLYEWGTGGALVDSTGADLEGRLTDHENLYVERTMEDNMTVAWQGNKIGSRHALLTMFWRDKDDLFAVGNSSALPYVDINADGQNGAMDAVNPSHVRNAMAEAGLEVLTHDGVITHSEISAQKSALTTYLSTDFPGGPGVFDPSVRAPKLKLSFMGVFFKANHGTSPKENAWGAGGCSDCHGADKGFYNGSYALKPRDLTISWNNNSGNTDDTAIGGKKPKWSHVVPFTKVNTDNYSGRNVTVPICSSYYGPDARPAPPETPAEAAVRLGTAVPVTGDACEHPGTTSAGTWTIYALGKIKADFQFTDFHPTIWAKGQKGRSLAIKAVYGATNTMRAMDRSEGLWEANFVTGTYDGTIVGTDMNSYTTSTAWVTYLNGQGYQNGQGKYREVIHTEHVTGQGMNCSDCHFDGTNHDSSSHADSYAVASDTFVGSSYAGAGSDHTPDSDDLFTPTPHSTSGYVTCATFCHVTGVGAVAADKARANIVARHSAPNGAGDPVMNFTVNLDASKSDCYHVNTATGAVTQGSATYTWSFAGTVPSSEDCTIGNPVDCVATWAVAGTNPVTLDVTCDQGATTDSVTVDVTGFEVEGPTAPTVDFTTTVTGSSVNLRLDPIPSNTEEVRVSWTGVVGHYTDTQVTESADIADLVGTGVDYVYSTAGTHEIIVTISVGDNDPSTVDASFKYTFADDTDLKPTTL